MLDHDRAAARAALALRGLYIFTHEDAFGRAPAHTLLDLVKVKPLGDASARSFSDYGTIEIPDADLPAGVTLTTLPQITQ